MCVYMPFKQVGNRMIVRWAIDNYSDLGRYSTCDSFQLQDTGNNPVFNERLKSLVYLTLLIIWSIYIFVRIIGLCGRCGCYVLHRITYYLLGAT